MSDNYLALLGTKGGPSVRPGSTMPTSSLLCLDGRLIVVDCGLGVTRGLVDQGMRLEVLSLIFITHLHSDHYLELAADPYRLDDWVEDPGGDLRARGVGQLLGRFPDVDGGGYRAAHRG